MRRENEQEKKQNGYCEQDMVDQIARLSENTEVPDSLRPENIDRLLKGKKQKKHFHSYRIGLAAACVAVVTGIIVWQYGSLHHGMIDSKRVSADNAERKISGSRKISCVQFRSMKFHNICFLALCDLVRESLRLITCTNSSAASSCAVLCHLISPAF